MVFELLTVTGLMKAGLSGDTKHPPHPNRRWYKTIGYPGSRNTAARTSSCHMLKVNNHGGSKVVEGNLLEMAKRIEKEVNLCLQEPLSRTCESSINPHNTSLCINYLHRRPVLHLYLIVGRPARAQPRGLE